MCNLLLITVNIGNVDTIWENFLDKYEECYGDSGEESAHDKVINIDNNGGIVGNENVKIDVGHKRYIFNVNPYFFWIMFGFIVLVVLMIIIMSLYQACTVSISQKENKKIYKITVNDESEDDELLT